MYHAFDFEKYAQPCLGEYQYRFKRRLNLAELFPRIFIAAAETGRCLDLRLRMAEDQCKSGSVLMIHNLEGA